MKVRIDPAEWAPFKKSAKMVVGAYTHVKLEEPGAVFLDGSLVGYGTEFKITAPDTEHELTASVPGAIHVPHSTETQAIGVPFTNLDKQPGSSPAEQAVKLALRKLNRKERELAKMMKAASEEEQRRRMADGLQDEAPEEEPEQEPEEEPAEEEPTTEPAE